MIEILRENPLLLLFLVVALGYPLGRLDVRGINLGVAAVLFAGLAVGALDPGLKLPEIMQQFGLALFVYTIGLSSGRGFFTSLRRHGARDAALVVGALGAAALMTVAAGRVLNLSGPQMAGIFTGGLTNTPSLAGALDLLRQMGSGMQHALSEPVVAYSVTYPLGVLGPILCIHFLPRFWRVDYAAEAERTGSMAPVARGVEGRTVLVTRPAMAGLALPELLQRLGGQVAIGRIRRGNEVFVPVDATRIALGDLVTIVCAEAELPRITALLGEESDERLDLDRREIDSRRIFVSNRGTAGLTLRELGLQESFGATVTRVRRGDVDMVARDDTVLELGDRVRVVAPPERMKAVSGFFGDSYRALSEVDILTFSLGLLAGVLLGLVPVPLPGGTELRLGLAGGPLVMAMVLGWRERTGPFVWGLPYSANLTLRQLGLVLFFAAVGTRSGYAFLETIRGGGGLHLLLAGAAVTFTAALLTLWLGYRVLKIPAGILIGMTAGMHTQPAALAFAQEQTNDELPGLGYAEVYALVTILKIVTAQLLITLFV